MPSPSHSFRFYKEVVLKTYQLYGHFYIPVEGFFLKLLSYISSQVLPVVLYGCETWSLTLREEGRLRMFENRVLRRVFGPKRDEVTGEWRKLHN